MTVTLSVSVMAHPAREAMVGELVEQLDRPVEVVWDRINDRHDTGVRALRAADRSSTHHLVLQDDVIPCRDLLAGVEAAMAHVPAGHPASLYIGRVRPFAAAVQKAATVAERAGSVSWIAMAGVYWGPAIVVPTPVVDELTDWFERARHVTNYDRRVSRWFEARNLECWYTWPSLVGHRRGESLSHPSASRDRDAHRFLGADVSALDVDWSGGVVEVPSTSRLDLVRQRAADKAGVA